MRRAKRKRNRPLLRFRPSENTEEVSRRYEEEKKRGLRPVQREPSLPVSILNSKGLSPPTLLCRVTPLEFESDESEELALTEMIP